MCLALWQLFDTETDAWTGAHAGECVRWKQQCEDMASVFARANESDPENFGGMKDMVDLLDSSGSHHSLHACIA